MDRAEAIGSLNFYRNRFYNEPLGTKERDLAEAINVVLPEYCALREQEQSKWISVEEKPMPEGDEEYEVCCDYHGEKRIEIHKGWNTHCVTHWRPLPEPPKEGADHE